MPVKEDHMIDELVGVFTDPLVVSPGGWADTIPEDMKESVLLERLINARRIGEDGWLATTDVECCIYLYTASFEAPMQHEWAEIYLYLGTQYLKSHQNREITEDIAVNELTDYQKGELNELRRMIHNAKMRQRKHRRREEKAVEKAAVVEESFEQLEMF